MFGIGPLAGQALASLGTVVVLACSPASGLKTGGTSVTITCLNAVAGATVKFGSTAPTGVSVTAPNSISCTTAAGDSYFIDDVTVTNAADVDVCVAHSAFDRVSSGTSTAVDPALLPNSTYALNYPGSLPWAGTACAIDSVQVGLGPLGSSAVPSTGTVQNGLTPAAFNGTTQALITTPYTAVDLMCESAGQWTAISLVYIVSASAPSGTPPADPCVWSSSAGNFHLSVATNGLTVGLNDGAPKTVNVACGTGAWHVVVARATGSQIKLRLDGSEATPTAATTTVPLYNYDIYLGKSAFGALANIRLGAQIFVRGVLSDADVDGIGTYLQTLFALSLGFSATSVDPHLVPSATTWVANYVSTATWMGQRNRAGAVANTLDVFGAHIAPGASTLNGHATATFNGSTQALQAAKTTCGILGTGKGAAGVRDDSPLGWSMFYVVLPASLPTDGGLPYVNSDLFTDPQAVVGIGLASDVGPQAFQIDQFDAVDDYVSTPNLGPLATGSFLAVQARWDGASKLQARSATGSLSAWHDVVCRPDCYPTTTGRPYIAANYSDSIFFTGTIAAIVHSQRAYSTDTLDSLIAWSQTYYALTLGVTGSGNTGTASITLDALTCTATGTVKVQGAAADTLGALTATATGTVKVQGAASPTLGNVTSTATGTVAVHGAAALTLDAVTLTATGTAVVKGQAATTLDALASSATGTVKVQGQGSGTLGDVTAGAAGTVLVQGQAAGTLGDVTATATARAVVQGVASIQLGDLTAAASAVAIVQGATDAHLDDMTAAGTGAAVVQGTFAVTLDDLSLVAIALSGGTSTGTATIGLDDLVVTATALATARGQVAVTLEGVSVTASGFVSPLGRATRVGCSAEAFTIGSHDAGSVDLTPTAQAVDLTEDP